MEELWVMDAIFFDLAYLGCHSLVHMRFEPINLGRRRLLSKHSLRRGRSWNRWSIRISSLRNKSTHIRRQEFWVWKLLQVDGFEVFFLFWYVGEVSLKIITPIAVYRPRILPSFMKTPSFWHIDLSHAWYLFYRSRKSWTLRLVLVYWLQSLLILLCLRSNNRLVHAINVGIDILFINYTLLLFIYIIFRLVLIAWWYRNFLPQLLVHLCARLIRANMMINIDICVRSRMESISLLLFQSSNRVVGELGVTAVYSWLSVERRIHAVTWPIERVSNSMKV